ncbi:MAG: hypothetical protein KAS91_00130 [Candidatus Pacebacteria bacterium]|nr:hypothetical protein [Candidatus Paceibacterota bacterium]
MRNYEDTIKIVAILVVICMGVMAMIGFYHVEKRIAQAEQYLNRQMLDLTLLQKESLQRIMMQIATAQKGNLDRIEIYIHERFNEILQRTECQVGEGEKVWIRHAPVAIFPPWTE